MGCTASKNLNVVHTTSPAHQDPISKPTQPNTSHPSSTSLKIIGYEIHPPTPQHTTNQSDDNDEEMIAEDHTGGTDETDQDDPPDDMDTDCDADDEGDGVNNSSPSRRKSSGTGGGGKQRRSVEGDEDHHHDRAFEKGEERRALEEISSDVERAAREFREGSGGVEEGEGREEPEGRDDRKEEEEYIADP
ncbi:hypothetical protein HK104_008236 [Borealophlyctis nickersoniae]|nr:hypothetical protein HK104_008236 [Borealophlyctis nickersoniae]